MKKTAIIVVAIVFSIYFFGSGISAIYFNWQYMRDNGLVKWLMLGGIVPIAKAVVWPYFLFQGTSDSTDEHFEGDPDTPDITSFENPDSLDSHIAAWLESGSYSVEANQIANRMALGQHPIDADISRLRYLLSRAVAAAHAVQPAKLNQVYPGLGDHFREDYLPGIERRLDAIENPQRGKMQEADALLRQWDNWYFKHQADIKRKLQELNFPVE